MIGLQSLYIESNQISDISFLQFLTGLKFINLGYNPVSDISFLKSLVNLQSLDLTRTQVSDISFLKSLVNLQSLSLGSTQISDISFLRSLVNLQSLDLSGNQISDYSFLQSLMGLQTLYLSYNKITDISFLQSLKGLQSLNLSYNKIFDISFLQSLTDLQYLYLSSNHISDISFLKSLTGLQSLDLTSNQISDYSFLQSLTGLKSLYLSSNRILDYSFLQSLKSLQILHLNSNQISDISFLQSLEDLQSLNLRSNQISDVSFLKSLISLQSLDLGDNNISDVNAFNFIIDRPGSFIRIDGNPLLKKHGVDSSKSENHYAIIRELLLRERSLLKRQFIYPLKVLLLGNHAAGKSSLVNYLTGATEEGSTHILRIKNYDCSGALNKKSIPDVIFYDFGGQDFYHGIYQVFISTGAFQLIVFDTRNDKNSFSADKSSSLIANYNRQYWLGQKRYKEQVNTHDPYIMIQTFADVDEVKEAFPIDYASFEGYRKNFFLSFASEEINDDKELYELGRKYFKTYFDFEVKKILKQNTRDEAGWYVDFLEFILDKKDKTHEPTALSEILKIYKAENVDDNDKLQSLQTNLTILHRHGLVLYYLTEQLKD